jgi:hypothetical protein
MKFSLFRRAEIFAIYFLEIRPELAKKKRATYK